VARLSPRKGAKAYFIQQYEANFGFPKDRVDATWRLPVQKIVCSGWLADLARDQFGDPSAVVVQNGVDTSLFHAPPRGKQAHPTVGFLYEPKAVVKGTGVALKVLESVGRRIPNLRVRAFGSVDLDPRFPLPALSEFTSRPRQNDLRAIYAGCDAWLCTSTSEGFHLPPHEAMACRCPVVSTKVGGPTDLVTDGVNGYLTEVGDVDRLADGLVKVLAADDAAWRQMSDAAYSVATGFTWERAAGLFETALREAIMREVHPPVV
jgi:glycosyltransferase involved in cell wall biosynthesis